MNVVKMNVAKMNVVKMNVAKMNVVKMNVAKMNVVKMQLKRNYPQENQLMNADGWVINKVKESFFWLIRQWKAEKKYIINWFCILIETQINSINYTVKPELFYQVILSSKFDKFNNKVFGSFNPVL